MPIVAVLGYVDPVAQEKGLGSRNKHASHTTINGTLSHGF